MKRVFYIEKEEFLRKSLELCFEGDCFCVSSTEDCFHFVVDLSPKVIVVDEDSVDFNKDSFFDLLKKSPQTASIPFVITGKEDVFDSSSSELNIKKYFKKPFAPLEFEQSLREIIEVS
jgi:DNA-binding response OmpR family regulator